VQVERCARLHGIPSLARMTCSLCVRFCDLFPTESAWFQRRNQNVFNRIQILLSISACASTAGTSDGQCLYVQDFVESVPRLAWAKANGCKWNEATCARAAEGGQLEVLQWAREHHCPWNANTCRHAARGGNLAMLQWAWENDCPWDAETCGNAATNGHLEVLQWARQQGCPWKIRRHV